MTNPYTTPIPPTPRPPDTRPLYKRVLVWIGGSALFITGAFIGSTGDDGQQPVGSRVKPATTITATVTATPKPAPTVTETLKAKTRPGPTVTITKTATAKAAGERQRQRPGQHRHVHDRLQLGELLLGGTVLPEQRPWGRHHHRERHEDQVRVPVERMALDLHLTGQGLPGPGRSRRAAVVLRSQPGRRQHVFQVCWCSEEPCTGPFTCVHGRLSVATGSATGLP